MSEKDNKRQVKRQTDNDNRHTDMEMHNGRHKDRQIIADTSKIY